MISISSRGTGIKNISIWLGPNKKYKQNIIKVSNIPNNYSGKDCFALTIPDFKIIGNVNKELITPEVLENIKKFVNLNYDNIISYYKDEIYPDHLITILKKI